MIVSMCFLEATRMQLPPTATTTDGLFVHVWRGPGYRKFCRQLRRAQQRKRAAFLAKVRQDGTSVAYPYSTGFTYNLYFGEVK